MDQYSLSALLGLGRNSPLEKANIAAVSVSSKLDSLHVADRAYCSSVSTVKLPDG